MQEFEVASNALNGAQKNILEGFLSFIFTSLSELTTFKAIKALNLITASELTDEDIAFLKENDVKECVEQAHQISRHDCPQNRADSYPYVEQEAGFSMFTLEKSHIEDTLLDGTIRLKNGRLIIKSCVIRNNDKDSYIVAKESTGLLSLTGREDETTPCVTKQAVLNYINVRVQEEILKQREIACQKIVLFFRERKLRVRTLISYQKVFDEAITLWEKRDKNKPKRPPHLKLKNAAQHIDTELGKINALENLPRFVLYHCVTHFVVTDKTSHSFHDLFLYFVERGNEFITRCFLANTGLNVDYMPAQIDFSVGGRDALYQASYQGNHILVKLLLRKGAQCRKDNDGFSGFMWAVRRCHIDVVRIYFEERSFNDLIRDGEDRVKLDSVIRYAKIVKYSDAIQEQEKNERIQKMVELIDTASTKESNKHQVFKG